MRLELLYVIYRGVISEQEDKHCGVTNSLATYTLLIRTYTMKVLVNFFIRTIETRICTSCDYVNYLNQYHSIHMHGCVLSDNMYTK